MVKLLVAAGVLLVLAGCASAQQGLLVMTQGEGGETTVGMITVNFLDIDALCAALGGRTVNLFSGLRKDNEIPSMSSLMNRHMAFPPPEGAGTPPVQTTQETGASLASGGGLNPNAPLAPFVPEGIVDIVGIK